MNGTNQGVPGRLAVVGGHAIAGAEGELADDAKRIEVETPFGPATALVHDRWVLLQRHGLDHYRAAFAIEHRANLAALRELGCDRVLSICSVGGLSRALEVGTLVCPDDFIALHLGASFDHGLGGERVPGFDPDWRQRVVEAWRDACEPELGDGGTYWQAIGPRFETPAEIRLIAAHAEVIGMTMAAECILAGELGLAYAAICSVDNLANGVGDEPLSVAEFEHGKKTNRATLVAALQALVPALL